MDGKRFNLGPLTPKQIFEDQMRIKRQYEEMDSSLGNSLGRETFEGKEKGEMSESKNSKSLIQNGETLGERKQGRFK